MKRLFVILAFLLGTLVRMEAGNQTDTTILVSHRLVSIHYPQVPVHGTILMLPGWNFSRDKTCENSKFCEKALAMGYVLVCPEMGKSVYASALFPETRKDWKQYPQLHFILDTLQSYLSEYLKLLTPGGRNFVYGISTGARGGALILENSDTLYCGGALLSGDYDQSLIPADNLMKGYYGSYQMFPSRWEGADNPARNAARLKMPIYLGHGKVDPVVPPHQSEVFAEILRRQGTPLIFSFKENEQHEFSYWNSETDDILKFFETCGRK